MCAHVLTHAHTDARAGTFGKLGNETEGQLVLGGENLNILPKQPFVNPNNPPLSMGAAVHTGRGVRAERGPLEGLQGSEPWGGCGAQAGLAGWCDASGGGSSLSSVAPLWLHLLASLESCTSPLTAEKGAPRGSDVGAGMPIQLGLPASPAPTVSGLRPPHLPPLRLQVGGGTWKQQHGGGRRSESDQPWQRCRGGPGLTADPRRKGPGCGAV